MNLEPNPNIREEDPPVDNPTNGEVKKLSLNLLWKRDRTAAILFVVVLLALCLLYLLRGEYPQILEHILAVIAGYVFRGAQVAQ